MLASLTWLDFMSFMYSFEVSTSLVWHTAEGHLLDNQGIQLPLLLCNNILTPWICYCDY